MKSGKWIPVSERLPGVGSDYYRTICVNRLEDSVLIEDSWYYNDPLYPEDAGWDMSCGWIVLAWMENDEE